MSELSQLHFENLQSESFPAGLNTSTPINILRGGEGGSYGRDLVVEKHRKLLRVYQNWVELEAFLSSTLARL